MSEIWREIGKSVDRYRASKMLYESIKLWALVKSSSDKQLSDLQLDEHIRLLKIY